MRKPVRLPQQPTNRIMKIITFESIARFHRIGALALTMLFAGISASFSEAGSPLEEKWKAQVPGQNAGFGISMATADGVLAIGALGGGDQGGGAVHFLDPVTGEERNVWSSPNAQEEGLFGLSIAIDDEFILISAPLEDGVEDGEGRCYFYDREAKEMVEIPSPVAEAEAAFGVSVALENGIALIGCLYEDAGGNDRGAAYLYDLRNRRLLRRLADPQPNDGDEFGIAVALSGGVAAVGAWRKDHPSGAENSGSVLLFKTASGNFIREIPSPVAHDEDGPFGNFGCSIELTDDRLIVGARAEEFQLPGNDRFSRGAVYVFNPANGELVHRISPENSQGDAEFGTDLAVNGDKLLVAAPLDSTEESQGGALYLYDLVSGRQIQQIFASDLDQQDEFGCAVAWHHDRAFTGSRFEGGDPIRNSGAVYRFTFGHQPDLLIGKTRGNFRGNDRYNRSGAGQQIRIRSNSSIRFFLRAQNDGSLQDRLNLRSRRNSSKFRYRIQKTDGGNVSGAMARGNYRSGVLFPNEKETFRVDVRPRGQNRGTVREMTTIRGRSSGDATAVDAVKAALQVRRR